MAELYTHILTQGEIEEREWKNGGKGRKEGRGSQAGRKRENFYNLVHSTNCCNSLGKARLKPGASSMSLT